MGSGSGQIVIDPSDAELFASIGLTSVKRVMKYQPAAMAAINASSETFPVDLDLGPDNPKQIYVKRYRYRRWGVRLAGMLRGTFFGTPRARFEYEFLSEMRRRGVPAIRPMAHGCRRKLGFVTACFLISESVIGAESLDTFMADHRENVSIRRRITILLAQVIRRMHDAGVMHGGLFWRNILVSRSEATGEWHLSLIDPDRHARLHAGAVPRKGVVWDLSDLAASAAEFERGTDIARFARAYFGVEKLSSEQKGLLQAVRKEARGKVRHEGHRLAVGGAIAWLQARIEAAQAGGDGSDFHVDTIEAFFDRLGKLDAVPTMPGGRDGRIHFSFKANGRPDAATSTTATGDVTLLIHEGRVSTERGLTGRADLTVSTDAETWLAILNGRPEAFDLVRAERLGIEGDTRLLTLVAGLMDAK